MSDQRQTPSFTDRLSRIGYLLRNTFSVVGRDTDIVAPWTRMVIYALVMVTAFFGGIVGLILGVTTYGIGGLVLAVGMYFYKFFFYNYREVAQSWLVYETICGKDRTYKEAAQTASDLASGVRKLAGLDMLMAYLMSQRDSKSESWGEAIVNMFLSGLSEVWDLVNHYMLPAIAIDRLTLTEGVQRMKELRNEVPKTLVGVFGIDLIGRFVSQVVVPLYLVLLAIAVGVTYWIPEALPEAFAFSLPVQDPIAGGQLVLNGLPLLAAVYVGKVFSAVLERTVTSVKVIYFTIFYTQITHKDRIAEDLRPQLVNYLRMEEQSTGEANRQPAEGTAPASQGASSTGST